jgi:hypothetical protein
MADEGAGPTDDGVAPVAYRDRVVEELVAFGADLRERGASVHANAAVVGARALASVGLDDRDVVRAALKSVYVSDPDDGATFDELFPAFWARLKGYDERYREDEDGRELGELLRRPEAADVAAPADEEPTAPDDAPDPLDAATRATERRVTAFEESGAGDGTVSGASPVGEGETVPSVGGRPDAERLAEAVERLGAALATLPGRRRHAHGSTGRRDARHALRQSLKTGGVVFDVPRRPKRTSDVRVTFLVDVSRSVLDTVDRSFLLGFLRAAHESWRRPRTFLFDTDCREVTDALDARTAAATRALETAEATWGGGTRIGEAFRTVREEAPDAVDRRTVVVVVSDGLETGDVDELESGVAWLADRAAGVVWLNPLAAGAGYRPTARGMHAALPYLDALFGFATPSDLETVADELSRYGLGGPVGYAYRSTAEGAEP